MASKRKTIVGVIFGGRSVEHDVSIVTANQIMRAFDKSNYEIVPVYITRDGKWLTGEPLLNLENFKEEVLTQDNIRSVLLSPDTRHHGLIVNPLAGRFSKSEIKRLDVIFPAIHGTHGEDGTLQGLFELADIPYVGFATLGSALTNDKATTKQILRQNNIPALDDITFSRDNWFEDTEAILEKIETTLTFPVFVKPATLGSSIGVSRIDEPGELLKASIELAANFDRKILVEPAVIGGIEINCAVMGYGNSLEVSVLEQPVSWEEFLSFENKYLQGSEGMKSADRIIPAPISEALTERIQQISVEAYKAVEGRGIARIDYLVIPETEKIYLNELNTMPGSLAFYLWQETGITPSQVVDKLTQFAREAHKDKRQNIYNYKTNLIHVAAARGVKGIKGSKRAEQQAH